MPEKHWNIRFLRLAKYWGQTCSKDPSTKFGAVIIDVNDHIISMGYNGFPRGVDDFPSRLDDRTIKYSLITHAEAAAICTMPRGLGHSIYVFPWAPCPQCAKLIIQSGIRRVYTTKQTQQEIARGWDTEMTDLMFKEANVSMVTYPREIIEE